ncbi:unnamed protein product [Knipowitschia caucasica]|uniref:Uncharacterized protein n=1 Tax=Knipowitschia caucasica TaxID=637954 RepID=A0AAV2JYG1_KNICA
MFQGQNDHKYTNMKLLSVTALLVLIGVSLALPGNRNRRSNSMESDTAHQRVARSGSGSTSDSGETTTTAATTTAATTTAAAGAALSAAQIQLIQALIAALG